ncbi:hypothetical protein EOM39_06385 [Candidatus Gracilibacteria bacterium]|nr:hypothetical protein [Candidatus Gracilibacteria bacterium]
MTVKTKRPKYIVTGFFFSMATMTVLVCFLLFFLYPKINEIGEEKKDVAKKIDSIELIKKKGLTFEEFNTLKNTFKANLYLASLLKKTDASFYNSNFVNNKDGEDYNSFFSKKVLEVNKAQSNEQYIEIQDSYKSILPTYVEENIENEEGVMTDLKFITYIESILYTFNLEMANKNLTVGNLNTLTEYSNDKDSALDTTIFYIPYTFDVTGKKKDILDFIYFLENVGSININEDGEIEVYEDNFINKSLNGFGDTNILKNQIIDIERIKISDYIDSGLEPNLNEKLISFVKRTQGGEKMSISLNVRFYVKGVPNYKIMEGVNNLSTRYNQILSDLSKKKSDKDLTSASKSKIEKALAYLKELDVTINEIKKEKVDLNKAYKKVLEINKLLDVLEKTTN